MEMKHIWSLCHQRERDIRIDLVVSSDSSRQFIQITYEDDWLTKKTNYDWSLLLQTIQWSMCDLYFPLVFSPRVIISSMKCWQHCVFFLCCLDRKKDDWCDEDENKNEWICYLSVCLGTGVLFIDYGKRDGCVFLVK